MVVPMIVEEALARAGNRHAIALPLRKPNGEIMVLLKVYREFSRQDRKAMDQFIKKSKGAQVMRHISLPCSPPAQQY